jgi:hypothetical protein
MSSRIRLAAVTAALLAASPSLAVDPAQDCTVCRDPMWPPLLDPMPGIPLDAPATEDRTGIPGDATWQVASQRSPGVGVAAAGAGAGVYSDPTWPTLVRPAAGIAASAPADAAPLAPVKSAPPAVASR